MSKTDTFQNREENMLSSFLFLKEKKAILHHHFVFICDNNPHYENSACATRTSDNNPTWAKLQPLTMRQHLAFVHWHLIPEWLKLLVGGSRAGLGNIYLSVLIFPIHLEKHFPSVFFACLNPSFPRPNNCLSIVCLLCWTPLPLESFKLSFVKVHLVSLSWLKFSWIHKLCSHTLFL